MAVERRLLRNRDVSIHFEPEKAEVSIRYLIGHVSDPTFPRISALLYIAELDKLENWGDSIAGDPFEATDYGPSPIFSGAFMREGSIFHDPPLTQNELDYLSTADRRCLDHAIKNFGNMPLDKLLEHTRDDAWIQTKTASNGEIVEIPLEMIIKQFKEGELLVDHFLHRFN